LPIWIYILIGGVVVCFILIAIALFVLKNRSNNNTNRQQEQPQHQEGNLINIKQSIHVY
jgi:large-conductance mechanosensitive channel